MVYHQLMDIAHLDNFWQRHSFYNIKNVDVKILIKFALVSYIGVCGEYLPSVYLMLLQKERLIVFLNYT